MSLYRPLEAGRRALRFKFYRVGEPIALSRQPADAGALGVRVDEERPYRIEPTGAPPSWIHDFGLELADDVEFEIDRVKALFENAFARVLRGEVENDDFNRLRAARAARRERIVVLRAYAKYLRQVGFTFSMHISSDAAAQPAIARKLRRSLHRALRPRARRRSRDEQAERARAIEAALDKVPNLDEDRILRQFLGADQRDGAHQLLPHATPTGKPTPYPVVQVRSGEGAGAARAQADVRDLRLFAALRRRASARRQGRARRPALVGPAARTSAPKCSAS